ncbi:MAG: M28 family peptidase [Kiritimatiellaceae bacterium]|nr:M28 family peptidase [Kiritimatiellaceae bacterium]
MVGIWFKWNAPLPVKVVRFLVLLVAVLGGMFVLTTQPSCTHCPPTERQVAPERLRGHVETLSIKYAPRDYRRIWNLNKCADYISGEFKAAGAEVSEQTFEVKGKTYRNIIGLFGPVTESRIVVGAHYDSCGDTPGADDNASGVAGLIELACLLGDTDLNQQVELVAFTLEEPPFFRTGNMGSARHAYRHRQNGVEIEGMICLEMIGYFSDEKGSQQFPSALLKLFYPDTGNFIAVIGSIHDRKLAKKLKESMRGATDLPVHSMSAPKGFPGLDFSDHLNYWNHGYTAVMVTDTAFMRNLRYHRSSDTVETLDFDRMANVVLGVYEGVVDMANDDE